MINQAGQRVLNRFFFQDGLGCLYRFRHGVKVADQVSQFVSSRRLQSMLEVTLNNLLRGAIEFLYRKENRLG